MTISRLQSTGQQSSGSVASVSKAFASDIGAQSLIVVCGVTSAADMPPGVVTDTQFNVYTRHGILQRASSERVAIFSAVSNGAGPLTITLDATGSDFQTIGIAEYQGRWDGDRVHVGFTSATGASAAPAAGNLITTVDSVVVGGFAHNGGGTVTITPVSPWNELFEAENTANMPIGMIDQIVAAGTYNPSWTTGISVSWTAGGVAFKEAPVEYGRAKYLFFPKVIMRPLC